MLTIKRPTSSTVLYTVSTQNPATNLAGYAYTSLVILARILASLAVAIALYLEYDYTFNPPPTQLQTWLTTAMLTSSTVQAVSLLASSFTQTWRLLLCTGVAWLTLRKDYTEESLLVIRGLGVQTSTSSSSYLWANSTRFIPTNVIQDIFIHEAFRGFEVKFYLSIVIEGDDEVVVVFPSTLPRRDILETVWRGARSCLYEPKT